MDQQSVVSEIAQRSRGYSRYMVALAGAPGSGKSTLADELKNALIGEGIAATVMPMDGYHFDNAVIEPLGLLARKGAPETFDIDGFFQDLLRIRSADRGVAVPVFDRDLDLARAGARMVGPEEAVVIIEGNYLLLNAPGWADLSSVFDLTILLEVSEPVLLNRLIERWRDQGFDPVSAERRARENDLVNARLVMANSRAADLTMANG